MTLSKVSCKYGAPMGRRSSAAVSGKVKLNQVRLDSGGYDSGGAYWGTGQALWHCQDSEGNELFFRSANRDSAKKELQSKHTVTFYR